MSGAALAEAVRLAALCRPPRERGQFRVRLVVTRWTPPAATSPNVGMELSRRVPERYSHRLFARGPVSDRLDI